MSSEIEQIYKAVLERSADAGGLRHWTDKNVDEGMSIKEIVRHFGHSDEYKRRFILEVSPEEAVRRCNLHFLGREPESTAVVEYHKNVLLTHGFQALINGFVDSKEYADHFGNNLCPRPQ
jgi:hypothetical protein